MTAGSAAEESAPFVAESEAPAPGWAVTRGDIATTLAGVLLIGATFTAQEAISERAAEAVVYVALLLLAVYGALASRLWLALAVVAASLAVGLALADRFGASLGDLGYANTLLVDAAIAGFIVLLGRYARRGLRGTARDLGR